eukprot:1158146-Pelagomonas_calceolata.AAC.5
MGPSGDPWSVIWAIFHRGAALPQVRLHLVAGCPAASYRAPEYPNVNRCLDLLSPCDPRSS